MNKVTDGWHIGWMAIRPKTLGAAIAPVIMGSALAYDAGQFHFPSAIAALLGAVLIQIITNLANDYGDFFHGADKETRIGPQRILQSGLVSPKAMIRAIIVVLTLSIGVGVYLIQRGGWPILLIGIFSLLSGILYTLGPFPLAYLGLGDIFVLIFFGPIAVAGTFYVQSLTFSFLAIIVGSSIGSIAVALLAVNNWRDMDQDNLAGKKTLAVRWGYNFAKTEFLICLILPFGIAIGIGTIYLKYGLLVTILPLLLIVVLNLKKMVSPHSKESFMFLLSFSGRILYLYGFAFALGWIL